MGRTSSEVKQRWESENYSKYVVRLRHDADKAAIDYIESRKDSGELTTEIFREAIEALMEKEKPLTE